jgi:hypothetical protein
MRGTDACLCKLHLTDNSVPSTWTTVLAANAVVSYCFM